jgi:hypothetical protein
MIPATREQHAGQEENPWKNSKVYCRGNHTESGPQVRNSCCSVVARIIRCPGGNRESTENGKFVRVKSSKKPTVLERDNQKRENFFIRMNNHTEIGPQMQSRFHPFSRYWLLPWHPIGTINPNLLLPMWRVQVEIVMLAINKNPLLRNAQRGQQVFWCPLASLLHILLFYHILPLFENRWYPKGGRLSPPFLGNCCPRCQHYTRTFISVFLHFPSPLFP